MIRVPRGASAPTSSTRHGDGPVDRVEGQHPISASKDGVVSEFTSHLPLIYTESGSELARRFLQVHEAGIQDKEDAMLELTVLFTMVFVRIILPVGLLLLIGELSRSRKRSTLRGI